MRMKKPVTGLISGLDSGFAGHSASKTRLNVFMARAPE
jgi:hypothetical protein